MITWILIGGAVSGAGVLFLVLFVAPPAARFRRGRVRPQPIQRTV